jgi:hypothetical protein
MRRTLVVAFLSALLVTVPSGFAQRAGHSGGFGGGHAGGFGGGGFGGHSFGGGFAGGSFGRSSGFASRGYASAPRFTSTAPTRAFTTNNRLPYGISADHRDRGRDFRYRSPYRSYGYGYGYPYANSWELLPWDIGYPDFTGYGDYDDSGSDVAQQPAASVAAPDDGYRQDYVGRDYGGPGYGDQAYGEPGPGYQGYGPAYPDPQPAEAAAPEPQLTLIFNDGHTEPIRNYVLTSSAVIVLDQAASGHQQRIPLASLNLPATEQAAQQAGLDFSPPA